MLRRSLTITARDLLNLLGLALGMTLLLFLLLSLRSELGYDRFHDKADRIYRVTEGVYRPGEPIPYAALTSLLMGPTLREDFPEVVEAARVMPVLEGLIAGKVAVRHGRDKQFSEWFAWADDSFLRIFTLPLAAGDPARALKAPNTVIVSESAARRYFGGGPAVGQRLKIDSGFSDEVYEVTGVFRDIPYDSHFHFDVIASFSSLDHVKDVRVVRDQWWVSDAYTYVLLDEGVSAEQVDRKFPAFVDKYFGEIMGSRAALRLQPLTDIHLRSHLLAELEPNGDVANVYLIATAALLVLLVACLNFMVLSAARHAGRREDLPASRSERFRRLFTESLLPAAAAVVLAAVLVRLGLPAFHSFIGKPVGLPDGLTSLAVLIVLVFLAAMAAGACGAFALPASGPAGSPAAGRSGAGFRRALVVFELALSAVLLVSAGVVRDQLRFVREVDLGFDMDDVLVVPIRDVALRDNFVALKAAMESHPNVRGTSFSSLVLGRATPQIGSLLDGVKELVVTGTLVIDPDFLEVFQIDLVAGRPLSNDPADFSSGFLINEAMLPLWNLRSAEEAVGKTMNWNGNKPGKVAGVVRSFHHQPLQHAVEPLVLHMRPLAFRYMYLRLAPQDTAATVRALAGTWAGMSPDKPFEPFFLDDEYHRAYRGEELLGKAVGVCAPFALFFACLGLLGHAAFRAGGSSVAARARPLWKESALLVAAALLLAWPAAYLLAREWLQHFGYRTEIRPLHFALAGVALVAAVWLTAAYASWRSARSRPAEVLRAA